MQSTRLQSVLRSNQAAAIRHFSFFREFFFQKEREDKKGDLEMRCCNTLLSDGAHLPHGYSNCITFDLGETCKTQQHTLICRDFISTLLQDWTF